MVCCGMMVSLCSLFSPSILSSLFSLRGSDGLPLFSLLSLYSLFFVLSSWVWWSPSISLHFGDRCLLVGSNGAGSFYCFFFHTLFFSLILLFVWFPRKWRERKIKIGNWDINVLIFGFNYNGVRSIFVLFHIQSFLESLFTCRENGGKENI